jgi:hypothetical protein
MSDEIQNRNQPQLVTRSTSCDMCGVERARHYVPTRWGMHHLCDACRLKYQLPNNKKG